jgi:hypothetical protein
MNAADLLRYSAMLVAKAAPGVVDARSTVGAAWF